MDKGKLSDGICILASIILIIMSIISISQAQRMSYEVNTGFFCAFFCLVPLILRRMKWVTLPLPFVLLIEVAIFLHAYGVLLLRYDFIPYWDTVTHTISSVTVALCVFYTLMVVNGFDPDTRFTSKSIPLFIFLIMFTFSAYWEVFELIVDEVSGTNMQYSPWDTIRDLVCDTAGALIVSIYAMWYMKRNSEDSFVDTLKLHPYVTKLILPFHKG